MKKKLKYHHLGIPTKKPIKGEVYLKGGVTGSDLEM